MCGSTVGVKVSGIGMSGAKGIDRAEGKSSADLAAGSPSSPLCSLAVLPTFPRFGFRGRGLASGGFAKSAGRGDLG